MIENQVLPAKSLFSLHWWFLWVLPYSPSHLKQRLLNFLLLSSQCWKWKSCEVGKGKVVEIEPCLSECSSKIEHFRVTNPSLMWYNYCTKMPLTFKKKKKMHEMACCFLYQVLFNKWLKVWKNTSKIAFNLLLLNYFFCQLNFYNINAFNFIGSLER